MVRGETYDKQLFESEAFRHFINIFLNKQSGVTKGCEVTKETENILVGPGSFVIQGGFLREVTGTKNEIPSEAGYYKLVYEVDLSKTNTKDEFKQGSYKFVKALGDYPKLIQEDLDNGGTIYQLPFCQFRVTEAGLQDFKDLRELIEYRIFQKNVEEAINEATEKNIITGEEFETNKTIDGKRIYGKRINCGQLPDPGQGSRTSTGLTNVTYIGLEGGFNPDGSQFLPCNIYFNNNVSIGAFIQDNTIRIGNNESGGRTGIVYVTVYYIKE